MSELATIASSGEPKRQPIFQKADAVVLVLAVLYALSALDRNLPALLLPHIQEDMLLSDTQVSLLTGAAFAIVYVAASVPFARLADSWSRRGIIIAGLAIWGVMTTLCGIVSTYPLFFLARMGVGFGEAAIGPAAFAMIAVLYPSGKRARPTSIMALGFLLGTAGAMLLGGGALAFFDSLKHAFPKSLLVAISSWRLVMMSAGIVTLLMLWPTMKIVDPPSPRTKEGDTVPSFREAIAEIWLERRAYAPVLFAFPFHAVGLIGFNTWITTIFVREHGWSVSQAGLKLGSVTVIGGLIGVAIASMAADRVAKRSESAVLSMALWCFIGCTILTWLIVITGDAKVKLVLVGIYQVVVFPINVIALVAVQECAHPKIRALILSLVSMVASLVGVGLGPTLIALFTEYVFRDPEAVAQSLACAWLSVLVISGAIMFHSRDAFVRLVRRRREAAAELGMG